FSAALQQCGHRGREPTEVAPKTDLKSVLELSAQRTLGGAPEGRDRSSGSSRPTRSFASARAPRWRRKTHRAAAQATIRWCRQKRSISPALCLIVVGRLPLELSHEIEQALLPSSCDEFFEGFRDRSLLGAFTA